MVKATKSSKASKAAPSNNTSGITKRSKQQPPVQPPVHSVPSVPLVHNLSQMTKPLTISQTDPIRVYIKTFLNDPVVIDRIKALYNKIRNTPIKGNAIYYIKSLLKNYLKKQILNIQKTNKTFIQKRTTKRGTNKSSVKKVSLVSLDQVKIDQVKILVRNFFNSEKIIKEEIGTGVYTPTVNKPKSKINLSDLGISLTNSQENTTRTTSEEIYKELSKSDEKFDLRNLRNMLSPINEDEEYKSPQSVPQSVPQSAPHTGFLHITGETKTFPGPADLKNIPTLFLIPRIPKNPKHRPYSSSDERPSKRNR